MARYLGKDSFTILRAPLQWSESAAAMVRDWDNAEEEVVTNAQVMPFKVSEKLNYEVTKEREYSRTAMRFFAPPGTEVTSMDRISYRGKVYDVLGQPNVWTNFQGKEDHVAFICRIREG